MKIEFSVLGDGTNIEVRLVDDDDFIVDRCYTACHYGDIDFGEERGVPIKARYLFAWVEETWAKPIIGGRYGRLHLYWHEREEKRKPRED